MRRREKFVISSILLSGGLLGVQYVPLEWRYLSIAGLMFLSYLVSAWALSDDLQWHEWLTILPLPTIYTTSLAFFYFLLPSNLLSRIGIISIFGVGIYALFLTSNIYSVAKGRTIQLLYAARAVGLFFVLIASLLFTNSIFSLKLPIYLSSFAMFLVHFPLIFMSLWSVNLEDKIKLDLVVFCTLITVLITELSILLLLLPLAVWHSSLFIMGFIYISLGVAHSLLRGRLFSNTSREYSLVAFFILFLFFIFFPLK